MDKNTREKHCNHKQRNRSYRVRYRVSDNKRTRNVQTVPLLQQN